MTARPSLVPRAVLFERLSFVETKPLRKMSGALYFMGL
jgi:hypothetical protein